jgi:hypothetical protein
VHLHRVDAAVAHLLDEVTSAQISAQARYAPSTESSRPTLTKTTPHGPTTDSSTAAIDGWRMPAMSARCSTA